MAKREILVIPDKRLRDTSAPIKAIDADVRALVDDMFETMYAAPGIGLASIQIGVAQRVVTMDLAQKDDPPDPKVFINPEIVWSSDEKSTYDEGCLSIPDIYGDVVRPFTVTFRAMDENGKEYEATGSELLGRCIQHEIDHLDGKLFLDYLSPLKRKSAMSKWEKSKAEYPGFIRKVRAEVKGEHHHANESEM